MSKWNNGEHRDPVIPGHTISLLMPEQKMGCSECGCKEFIILKANGELRADCNKCRSVVSNLDVRIKT